jgi:aspartyl aminopeptidase
MTLDVKKSNSSNETPNVMTVGIEKYGQIHETAWVVSNLQFPV